MCSGPLAKVLQIWGEFLEPPANPLKASTCRETLCAPLDLPKSSGWGEVLIRLPLSYCRWWKCSLMLPWAGKVIGVRVGVAEVSLGY